MFKRPVTVSESSRRVDPPECKLCKHTLSVGETTVFPGGGRLPRTLHWYGCRCCDSLDPTAPCKITPVKVQS